MHEYRISAEERAAGIRTGIDALLSNVPEAVERMKAIGVEAETVSSAFKEEISDDHEKQYAMVKLLSSDIGSGSEHGFQDPSLTLATFFGIADYDHSSLGTHLATEITSKLHDRYFDIFIAREILAGALEKISDGDPLSIEESALCAIIDAVQYYSHDDDAKIIDAFSTPEGIDRWSAGSQYLLIGRREWHTRSIAANVHRIQNLIYDNYLGARAIDKQEFVGEINKAINENINITQINGFDLARSNGLRERAEFAQRQQRLRILSRLVGENALVGQSTEVNSAERAVKFLVLNGDGFNIAIDDERGVIDRYLKIYGNDPKLAEDLNQSISFLRRLSPSDMSKLLSQANGLRTMKGHTVRVNGQTYTVHRMKPKRIAGLPTKSPSTDSMRIMFVQLKQGDLGILDVVRRDRLNRYNGKR